VINRKLRFAGKKIVAEPKKKKKKELTQSLDGVKGLLEFPTDIR